MRDITTMFQGELVKVFTNENRKIVCDPDMLDRIRRALQTGYAEHRLSLWKEYLDIWEPITLVIKKDGINIKGGGTLVHEKFTSTTTVLIPNGNPVEFSIIGVERRNFVKVWDTIKLESGVVFVL